MTKGVRFSGLGREGEKDMNETATITPEPQRLRALSKANEVRLARADLKRRIAEGDVLAADVILESPWEAQSWALGELLLSQRRWGASRCRKFLWRHQILENKPVGTLTDRQRNVLAEDLPVRPAREMELVGV
jgi:hypothetical protein